MRQLILPIPFLCLALSGCVRQPDVYAIKESSAAQDYHQRSDSALALLDSMSSHPKTVYVKTVQTVTRVDRVEVPKVQKETVYLTEESFPLVKAMPAPVYIRDTVSIERVQTVEKVTLESPKKTWSLFTIKRVVDTVTVYVRDTVYIAK
jgi:hypothetical protein